MDLDSSTDVDSQPTKADDPPIAGPDVITRDVDPTVTLPQRDRSEAEASLLFGLLALANGLIEPESLTGALGAWAGLPGRPLREVLVEQGHLDESDASVIAALASKHLEQHHGVAWESLIALRKSIRFRLDPSEVADSELRGILAGVVDDPASSRGSIGTDGLSRRYEIIRHHARGGLGVISVANDLEIHREVAVKEIRNDCADHPDYRARFLREAEVTGRLEHPGIVPVYGIGYHDDGRPYYIMRFIRGETLKVAISRLHKVGFDGEEAGTDMRPDLPTLVGRFIDACHAVAYAHHRKILHRDLKPINIMLGPFGETLVVDWGLAKSFDGSRSGEFLTPGEEGTLRPESGSELTPTRMGSQVGTTGFMSPEQAAGLLTQLGPTSDIYSLGVTLYCLITGRAPFEGTGKDEFLRRVLVGEFPEPSKINPSVPQPLVAICLKSMALRPVDRYQAVSELIDDLERWRAGSPVLAYPEPFLDRLARWAKRHKPALAGAAVLLVCATIGMAIFAAQEQRENRRVNAERLIAQGDLDLARKSSHLLLEGLSGPGLTYLPNSGPPRLELAGQLIQFHRDLIRKHPVDPVLKYEMARAILAESNIRRSMGQFDPARKGYDEVIGLLEVLSNTDPASDDDRILLVSAYIDRGEALRMSGRPKDAEGDFLKALGITEGSPAPPGDDRYSRIEASALMDLAACRVETDRPRDAGPQANRAVEILLRLASKPQAYPTDRLLLVYALNTRATASRKVGELQVAGKDLTDAVGRAKELRTTWENTDSRFAMAMSLNEQGLLLSKLADYEGASSVFNGAFVILANLLKSNQHVPFMEGELAASLNGRGAARLAIQKTKPDANALTQAQKECAKAREYLDQLCTKWPKNYVYQSSLGQTLANLGRIAKAQGDPKGAREFLKLALERHRIAIETNPNSPDDKAHETAIREEIEALPPALPQTK
jgi:eukaryotic-like serine/threonine-protein kinase